MDGELNGKWVLRCASCQNWIEGIHSACSITTLVLLFIKVL